MSTKGRRVLKSAHVVAVGDDRLTSDQIFINVGGRAIVPPMPGLDQITYFTNSSMMGVDFLPEHLIVVGGSYIGLEFGADVSPLRQQSDRPAARDRGWCPREDEDISAAIREHRGERGHPVRLNATCISFEKRGDQIRRRSGLHA